MNYGIGGYMRSSGRAVTITTALADHCHRHAAALALGPCSRSYRSGRCRASRGRVVEEEPVTCFYLARRGKELGKPKMG